MTPFKKLENFFSQYKLFKYKKGEAVLRSGDTPQGVYLVKKGYIKLYSICREGAELDLIIFKTDDFFPVTWVFNDKLREEHLEAMTESEVWRAPKDKFVDFIKANPDVLFELTSRILGRLDGLLQRMEHLVFGNAYEKVASILVICSERFGEKEKNRIVIQVPLTHKDIANLAGVVRETASIELKKLERKGIIMHSGGSLIVRNMRELVKESLLDFG